jgi:inhibitor of cysteine peptidase
MFTKLTLALVTIILLFTLVGCVKTTPSNSSSNTGEDNSQKEASETYTGTNSANNYQMLPIISGKVTKLILDASADGTTQELEMGEVMSITLEANPSTGYGWFATSTNPDVLAQLGEPVYQEPTSDSATPILGAAGVDTFIFQAADTGTATITLVYKRGWETDVAPEKTITITVNVK